MSNTTVTIDANELDRLRAIEDAALRFDKAGAVAHQLNPEQWAAYLGLKALFHGGIAGEEPKENETKSESAK